MTKDMADRIGARGTAGAAAASQQPTHHIPPATADMFRDEHPPQAFTMSEWTRLRDLLFHAGRPHRHDRSHARRALFRAACHLNNIQACYVFDPADPRGNLTVVGIKGRQLAEVAVKFFLPPAVLGNLHPRADLNAKIRALDVCGAVDPDVVARLDTLRIKSNHTAHEEGADLLPSDKPEIADAAFVVAKVWDCEQGRAEEI